MPLEFTTEFVGTKSSGLRDQTDCQGLDRRQWSWIGEITRSVKHLIYLRHCDLFR